jgi:nucleoside-diphosphate-sugar epimerase
MGRAAQARGAPAPPSLLELIDLLRQAVGGRARDPKVEHQAPRAGDLRASSADLSRAQALLGYVPKVTLAEGLIGLVGSLLRPG